MDRRLHSRPASVVDCGFSLRALSRGYYRHSLFFRSGLRAFYISSRQLCAQSTLAGPFAVMESPSRLWRAFPRSVEHRPLLSSLVFLPHLSSAMVFELFLSWASSACWIRHVSIGPALDRQFICGKRGRADLRFEWALFQLPHVD